MDKTRSRLSAFFFGTAATIVILVLARLLLYNWNNLWEPILAGVISGTLTSWLARTYYSGNPALAYAFSLLGLQTITSLLPANSLPINYVFHSVFILAIMMGLVLCICACWAVDVYIHFPRLYPNPKDRPVKHITLQTYLTKIFPGTLLLILGVVGASILLQELLAKKIITALAIAITLLFFAACSWLALFKIQLPGSLWIGFGPLIGILLLDFSMQIPLSSYLQKAALTINSILPLYWLPACFISISLASNALKKVKV